MGFEINVEDVMVVAHNRGVSLTEAQAEALFDQLDDGAVEKAALYGEDLDAQTQYAYEEIEKQLDALDVFSNTASRRAKP